MSGWLDGKNCKLWLERVEPQGKSADREIAQGRVETAITFQQLLGQTIREAISLIARCECVRRREEGRL